MEEFCLGADINVARFIFLLPNRPILPDSVREMDLRNPDVTLLTTLNGNHWRKIFTIMAKITSPVESDWRAYRDTLLFNETLMVFSVDQLKEVSGKIFIVGNSFREGLPIPESSQVVGAKQQAYVESNKVWCPYLDYRQFPNSLIAALRKCL